MTATVTLTCLGDLMLGREVRRKRRQHPPEWFWGNPLPVVQRARPRPG